MYKRPCRNPKREGLEKPERGSRFAIELDDLTAPPPRPFSFGSEYGHRLGPTVSADSERHLCVCLSVGAGGSYSRSRGAGCSFGCGRGGAGRRHALSLVASGLGWRRQLEAGGRHGGVVGLCEAPLVRAVDRRGGWAGRAGIL